MSAWKWVVSIFYALLFAVIIVVVVTLLLTLVAWAVKACGGKKKKGCGNPNCAPVCPVYVRNPKPDDRVFQLARVDGSTSGSANGCATGSFTIQRLNSNQLLYTVTTPADTLITDIYALEVSCENDFPLTLDRCGVDLTQFHHQTFACDSTSNVQTLTSTLSSSIICGGGGGRMLVSLLVIFSDSETCDPVQMMTIVGRAAKPIALTGNCITPPCPTNACCDPIVPNFVQLKLAKCRIPSSSSSSSIAIATSSAIDHEAINDAAIAAPATATAPATTAAAQDNATSEPPPPISLNPPLPNPVDAAAANPNPTQRTSDEEAANSTNPTTA